jgi:hypothetical protein
MTINFLDYMLAGDGDSTPDIRSVCQPGSLGADQLIKHLGAVEVKSHKRDALDENLYTFGADYARYYFHSVVGCAVEMGRCAINAVAWAQKNRHPLWFCNQTAAVIDGREKPEATNLKMGKLIIFMGRAFVIRERPYGNIGLHQVDVPALLKECDKIEEATRKHDRIIKGGEVSRVIEALNASSVAYNLSGGPREFVIHFDRENGSFVDRIIHKVRHDA